MGMLCDHEVSKNTPKSKETIINFLSTPVTKKKKKEEQILCKNPIIVSTVNK